MSIAAAVSVPYARSQGAWIALKVVGGLVGAPLECLGEITIADVFFSHERGTYLAAYSFMLYTAGFLAPILAGYITEGLGWRWVQASSLFTQLGYLLIYSIVLGRYMACNGLCLLLLLHGRDKLPAKIDPGR